MIAAKKTRWFRNSYRNTCIRSMEKENDEYLKTIKLKVTKCKRTQDYKSSFTVVFFPTIQLHHKFITSHTTTKNEIQTRFSKWCENEKRKLKFISVFQRDAKTKCEVQTVFQTTKTKNKKQNSNLFFNVMRKRKMEMALDFPFPMPSKNGWHQGTRIREPLVYCNVTIFSVVFRCIQLQITYL